jgi:hypothetical protein
MDDQIKLKYYDILNSIKTQHLKSNILFNIINNTDIKLNHNEIKLKYINNKNYFKKVDTKPIKQVDTKPIKQVDTKPIKQVDTKPIKQVDIETKLNNTKPKTFTSEETAAYLKRRSDYKKEKLNNNKHRTFTPEETAAYLKRRSDYKKEKLSIEESRNSKLNKSGGNSQILIFY